MVGHLPRNAYSKQEFIGPGLPLDGSSSREVVIHCSAGIVGSRSGIPRIRISAVGSEEELLNLGVEGNQAEQQRLEIGSGSGIGIGKKGGVPGAEKP